MRAAHFLAVLKARGAVSGQFAKREERFSTNPKSERGNFEILTNPKAKAGMWCSKASKLPREALANPF
jgi:hypothetical protein